MFQKVQLCRRKRAVPKNQSAPDMHAAPEPALFAGDVEVQTTIRVSRKGGSLTAILKKILVERLGLVGDTLAAATIDLGAGRVLVLGSPGAVGKVRIQRSGPRTVEVAADGADDAEVDEIAEAFLRLKAAQFNRGQLALSGPVTAEAWRARSEQAFARAAKRHRTDAEGAP
jgi:hypothetical protein